MEEKLKQDLKEAQLSHQELTVSTLRLLLSEIGNARIQKGENLSDSDIISLIQREVKKRHEASHSFKSGNREELAQKEESEAEILSKYLPSQLSNEELTNIVETSINEIGAKSIQDMGRVMGNVMAKVGQNASGDRVSAIVKSILSSE